MELNEIKQRLELALRPVEKPPTIEEVLEQASRRGVLRGPVDWVFPAWMLYVEYAVQKIAETFRLTEEERRALLNFRETLMRLLREAWMQTKERLKTLHKAVAEGTCKIEGNKLYAPDGTWLYVRGDFAPHITLRGVSASACFPNLLKLPHERLELFQLGWRASDESNKGGRPVMGTTQPWQVFAWVATRYGKLHLYIDSVKLTREGVSALVHIKAKDWRQRWSKAEAVDLVINHFRRGEWAPLLTMWLGDGETKRRKVLHGEYELIIAVKEPWRLGNNIGARKALVATGKEAFVKLRKAAGVYGELLDLLRAHKWIDIKLATDDGFRAAYKLKKRDIDVLREAPRRGAIVVAGVVMILHLVNSRGGSLFAKCYVRDLGRALAIADKLKAAGLRPNIVRSDTRYMVYIAMTDLLRLAENDDAVRRAIAQYLAEKAKNGTPKQRETVGKLLQRHPFFSSNSYRFLEIGIAVR